MSKLQSQHLNMSIDKASISICVWAMLISPPWKKHLKGTTQILRATETKVLHLQHHFKEVHSKGILLLSHILILPQTVAETGRAVPLVLKCNPLARRETSQELSTNHLSWVFQTGISLHKLTSAERAGITPQLPLKTGDSQDERDFHPSDAKPLLAHWTHTREPPLLSRRY